MSVLESSSGNDAARALACATVVLQSKVHRSGKCDPQHVQPGLHPHWRVCSENSHPACIAISSAQIGPETLKVPSVAS